MDTFTFGPNDVLHGLRRSTHAEYYLLSSPSYDGKTIIGCLLCNGKPYFNEEIGWPSPLRLFPDRAAWVREEHHLFARLGDAIQSAKRE